MSAAAAAYAFVRRRCLFSGAAACSTADDPSRVKLSCFWGWGRRYLSQSLPNPDHNPQNKILPQIQKQKVPWLMLSSPTKIESRYFYDLLNRGAGGGQLQAQDGDDGMPLIALNREIDLPQIAGHHCVGSSQGFLITIDFNAEIHATNPITGARLPLPLPSTATLPNMIGVARDYATGDIEYYISSKRCRGKPQVRPYIFEDNRRKDSRLLLGLESGFEALSLEFMRFSCYGRVVISPGLDFAALFPTWGSPQFLPAFARLGQDTSWTALPAAPNESVHDITFRDGRLYTVDDLGTLAIFDLDSPSSPPFLSPEGPLEFDTLRQPRYLVASPDGDDLFLLVRMIDFFKSGSGSGQMLKTKTFTVYKLDRSNFKWSRVTNIADYALFVGTNESVALSARDFPCIKPNSIYFTDYYICPYPNKDAGVFDLEDGSIHPLSSDNFRKFYWPPPIWFMPAMF